MHLIDARASTQHAINLLLKKNSKAAFKKLKVLPLRQFLKEVESDEALRREDKELICDQAILVLDQFYAHLPFKRARYAVDPIQEVRLLRAQIPSTEQAFHAAMISLFTSLRDVHTLYGLPRPYAGAFSFLPFFVDSYVSNGQRRFVVTDILEGFNPDPGNFSHLCEITAWSGVPIGKAVDLLAQSIPGGNKATRIFRGTMRLTVRSLTTALPPVEELVYVHFKPYHPKSHKEVEERVIAVPWYVGSGIGLGTSQGSAAKGSAAKSWSDKAVYSSSCTQLADLATVKSALWEQKPLKSRKRPADEDNSVTNNLPQYFQVHHTREILNGETPWISILTDEANSEKKFGYVRIYRFPDTFGVVSQEFQSILQQLEDNEYAADGLILDIRSNPGGNITEAECMLQMLTAKQIHPARFHFPNTGAVQSLLASVASKAAIEEAKDRLPDRQRRSVNKAKGFFGDWTDGVLTGAASGSALTDGRPITPVKDANAVGQIYQGPVTLLTDAGTYSAADILSGGFQDHEIGVIIGMDENTGGGGASSWHHAVELMQLSPLIQHPIVPLPKGAAFGLAIQRSTRVARYEGNPVEDLGVKSDILYRKTLADLGPLPEDLLRFACKTLATMPKYKFWIEEAKFTLPKTVSLTLNASRALDRLLIRFDHQQEFIVIMNAKNSPEDITKSTLPFVLQKANARHVEVQGFILKHSDDGKQYELVARDRSNIKAAGKASVRRKAAKKKTAAALKESS